MPRYLGSAAPGGGPLPAPQVVDAWRAKLVLARHGLLAAATNAIRAIGTEEARVYWEATPRWNRAHPWVAFIAFILDLSAEAVDDLFRQALNAE